MRRRVTLADVVKIGCLAGLVGYCIFAVAMLVMRGGESRRMGMCMSNMIQVYRGMRMHSLDHQGALPDAQSWADMLLEERLIPGEDVLHCPKAAGAYGYAMNSQLDGAIYEDIADRARQVLLFESATHERNAHDPLQSVPQPPRHPRGNHYMFVDGHGEWLEKVPAGEGGKDKG